MLKLRLDLTQTNLLLFDVFIKAASLIRFANHPYTLSHLTLETNKNDDHDGDDI